MELWLLVLISGSGRDGSGSAILGKTASQSQLLPGTAEADVEVSIAWVIPGIHEQTRSKQRS